ncbi:MAG: hypothetical protein WD534_11600 [Phycisphaeraceae bacterium]
MNADGLKQCLRQANRRGMAAGLLRAVGITVGTLVVALLLAVAVDAATGLPAWGLAAVDVLLLTLAVVLAVKLARQVYGWRYRPHRVAVMLERRMGWQDNRLINALHLAEPDAHHGSEQLREQAVRQGVQAAAVVPGAALVDHRQTLRGVGVAGGAALAGLLMYALAPAVFHAVLPRLFEPGGDHPPFTLLQFDITADPAPVYYGQPATIGVALRGPRLPEQANVVFVNDAGQRQRLPMYRVTSPVASASGTVGEAGEALTFQLQMEQVHRSRRFYIDTPEGRSRVQTLEMRPVPLFQRVEVSYDYPDYTGWATTSERLSPGGIRALTDTAVTLTFEANVPLAGGKMTLEPADEQAGLAPLEVTLTPDADDPTRARVRFTLGFDGRYAIVLHGADGTVSHETLRGSVRTTPDDLPRVRIAEPERQAIVPEGWTVPVQVAANDDIALDRLTLSRGVNQWPAIPTPLTAERRDRDGRQVTGEYAFDLEALGARAGDTIHFYATAYDTHPGGGQSADSAVHVFQVITMEEWAEFARQRYRIEHLEREWREMQQQLRALQAQREAALEQMTALREQMAEGGTLSEADRQRMAELAEELDAYSQEMFDLFEQIRERTEQPTLYEFERPFMDMLRRMHMEVQSQATAAADVSRAMNRARAEDTPANRQRLAEAMQRFADQQRPFTRDEVREREEAEQDLERLRLAEQLMAQTGQLQSVVEQQRELERRLARYRHRETLSPAEQLRAASLAEEQAALRREVTRVREQLRELGEQAAETLPQMSASAMDLADALEALQVERDQHDAERLAHAGQGRYAHQAADAAAEKLESLLAMCEGMGGRSTADLDIDRPLGMSQSQVRQSLQQMASARAAGIGASGSDGSGMQGSRSRMALAGPAMSGGGDADAAAQTAAGELGGEADGLDDAESRPAADTVAVEQTTQRGGGGAALPGVPARYRQAAEAYFQRLADDSR